MKAPKFTLTGKISLFKKHEDGTSFFMIVHRTPKGEYFSYPAKYIGDLPENITEILQTSPVIRAEGQLLSVPDDNGEITLRLVLQSFDILQPIHS